MNKDGYTGRGGVRFTLRESKSNIDFRWVHRESNLMLALSTNEDQRECSLSRSLLLGVNESYIRLEYVPVTLGPITYGTVALGHRRSGNAVTARRTRPDV